MDLEYNNIIEIKNQNGGIAIAFGCFDILHHGHRAFFEKVNALTTYPLCIGLLNDELIKIQKGPSRPINNENVRLNNMLNENVTSAFIINAKCNFLTYKTEFDLDDDVAPLWVYCLHALDLIRPTEFYYSTDFHITKEILAFFTSRDIKAIAVPYTEGISTTMLLNNLNKTV